MRPSHDGAGAKRPRISRRKADPGTADRRLWSMLPTHGRNSWATLVSIGVAPRTSGSWIPVQGEPSCMPGWERCPQGVLQVRVPSASSPATRRDGSIIPLKVTGPCSAVSESPDHAEDALTSRTRTEWGGWGAHSGHPHPLTTAGVELDVARIQLLFPMIGTAVSSAHRGTT
jgi:hypothetical protein